MEVSGKPMVTIYTQAYNSETYIGKCIESVLTQVYGNFEYFICDHGSKDRTGEIIRSYAQTDPRVVPLERANEERGFYPELIATQGKGKYFAMLDSDDYWASDCLKKLVEAAEEDNLDMVVCGIYRLNDSTGEISILRQPQQRYAYFIDQNSTYFPGFYNFLRTTWGKIIRMDVLRKADYTTYRKNAQAFISDDTAFSLANYAHCRRIGAIPDLLLYYRENPQAVTKKYNPALIDNNVNLFRQSERVLQQIGDQSTESHVRILKAYWDSVAYTCMRLFSSERSCTDKLAEIRRLFSTELMRELFGKGLYHYECIKYVLQCIQREAELGAELSAQDIENINAILLLLRHATEKNSV